MPFPIVGGGPGDYFGAAMPNACRFNDDDTAKLTKTLASSSATTWTYSTWWKRANGDNCAFFAAGSASDYTRFNTSNDRLEFLQFTSSTLKCSKISTQVLRDPSAWYHIVVVWVTTDGTQEDRARIYVNGVRVTIWDTNAPLPGASEASSWNTAVNHSIGYSDPTSNGPMDGYFAETVFVDGQALGPENFGETHPITGQWVPKTYGGTYGANGFRLDFADAADLGNDVSGNNNDFTSSGLATDDQVPDTPTDNHCTLNPIRPSPGTLANGNLDASGTVDAQGTFGVSSGKFAWEVTLTSGGAVGIEDQDGTENTYTGSASDVIQLRLDMDAGALDRNVNGSGWVSLASSLTGTQLPLVKTPCTVDFGQHGYSPPTGYKTLTARNLADPGILRGDNCFAANARSGTGASASVTGLRFQPGLVWTKSRDEGSVSYTGDHKIWDAVRGVTKSLESNTADQEATEGTGLSAFNSDGFDFGALAQINFSGDLFVDWCWKEGASPGFDIVRYSGDNTANRNIAHALGVAPGFALVKRLDASEDWFAWHAGLSGDDYFMKLNGDAAEANAASPFGTGNWSATQFMVDNDATNNANASGTDNYIAYLFAGAPGFSRFGGYVGNGNADGPFVWCGFRPAFVMWKAITAIGWQTHDAARTPNNPTDLSLFPDLNNADTSSAGRDCDFLANGFKLRDIGSGFNSNGVSYVFAAFAGAPFKYARAA